MFLLGPWICPTGLPIAQAVRHHFLPKAQMKERSYCVDTGSLEPIKAENLPFHLLTRRDQDNRRTGQAHDEVALDARMELGQDEAHSRTKRMCA